MKYTVQIREKSLTGDTVKTITISAPSENAAKRKALGGVLNNGRREIIRIEQVGNDNGGSSDSSIPGSGLGCQTIGITLLFLGAANIFGINRIIELVPALGKIKEELGHSVGPWTFLACLAFIPSVLFIIGLSCIKKKSTGIGLLLLILGGTPAVLGIKGIFDAITSKSPTTTTPTETR